MNDLQADLTETLYSILLGEADWTRFLDQLVSDRRKGGAVFMLQNDSMNGRSGQLEIASGLDSSTITAYAEYYGRLNPWVPDHILLAEHRGIADHEVISREELYRTEYYNDYLKPGGIEGSAGMTLSRRGGASMILTMVHGESDPEVSTLMAERLDLVKPRLMRVLDHYRMRSVIRPDGLANEALAVMGTGLCLIDDALKPVLITPAAERAAREGGLFSLTPTGRIRLAGEGSQQALQRLLQRNGSRSSEVVWQQNGYRMTLFRAAREPVSDLLCGPMVGLIIEPGMHPASTITIAAIRQKFSLTEAEFRVLNGISDGHSIRAMAELHGRSVETVRSQVKSLLHKTGCENQLALMRMIRNG